MQRDRPTTRSSSRSGSLDPEEGRGTIALAAVAGGAQGARAPPPPPPLEAHVGLACGAVPAIRPYAKTPTPCPFDACGGTKYANLARHIRTGGHKHRLGADGGVLTAERQQELNLAPCVKCGVYFNLRGGGVLTNQRKC